MLQSLSSSHHHHYYIGATVLNISIPLQLVYIPHLHLHNLHLHNRHNSKQREISIADNVVRSKTRSSLQSYQMKMIIRGASKTGKSSLWRRLQGLTCNPMHLPTPQIQVRLPDYYDEKTQYTSIYMTIILICIVQCNVISI